MKKQCYMTAGERHQLEAMRRNKIPIAEIARQLNRSRQTIYNELRRESYLHTVDYQDVVRYSADKGQAIRELASKCKGRRIKTENDADYMDFPEYMILKGKYSPAAALAEARAVGYTTTICVTTLYSYISKRRFPRLRDMDLLEKVSRRRRKKSEEPKIAHKDYPSIEIRPEHIGQRSEGGHWEMDLIVGCRGSKAVLLTLTERRSRQEIIVFHRPAPFVAVGIRLNIAKVVEQHTGEGFTDRQRDHAELDRTIIAHLNLDTVPMLTLLATFGSLIVDTDEHFALRASDLDACTLGADDALPIVGLADVHSALCIP